MKRFVIWLDEYKAQGTGRKYQLLPKVKMEKYVDLATEKNDTSFRNMYSSLKKGKPISNVLVDSKRPEGPDWDVLREEHLDKLFDGRAPSSFKYDDLFQGEKIVSKANRQPTDRHLEMILWGFSPDPKSI